MVENNVTLHLDRSRTARPFDLDESLWRDEELKQICRLLLRHLDTVSSREENPPLLALALFGSYGSGKTSLVETLAKLVNEPESLRGTDPDWLTPDDKKRLKDRVHSLPILRPNLVTKGESFLYAFLAAVLREEREWASRAPREEGARERSPGLFTPVEKSLQEVTEHLQVLDETREGSHHDPIGVSVARLERHASDYDLKRALGDLIHRFSRRALQDRDGLLLLPVDDTDLSQESLFETLDSIRRYLEHPRLVPICTFNGRLAEELLVAHFSKELRRQGESQRSEWYQFEAEIALQYLGRMFPVRNRIRLGATTVRVQKARYEVQERVDGEAGKGTTRRREGAVADLLERASKILFGFPQPLVEPKIKLALRPVVLRRQLQIVDAVHYAGVETLFDGPRAAGVQKDDEEDPVLGWSKRWAEVFAASTWALLDVHRDVLRELDIHLEDLYGWSARSLREWILGKLVDLKVERRSLLLDRWLHRTENKRGQVLSLLAANVFRPPLDESEEVPGEEPIDLDEAEGSGREPRLDTSQLYTWFLNLWLGFYLPQILFRDQRATGETASDMPTVGWHLEGAPVLAMHQAGRNRDLFGPGTMFLNHEVLAREVEACGNSPLKLARLQLLVNLWCFYGYERGKPWCAISLWRGLGLIGQLLRLRNEAGSEANQHLQRKIEYILHRHLAAGHQPGSVRAESEEEPGSGRSRYLVRPVVSDEAAVEAVGEDLYRVRPGDAIEMEVEALKVPAAAPEGGGGGGSSDEETTTATGRSTLFPYYLPGDGRDTPGEPSEQVKTQCRRLRYHAEAPEKLQKYVTDLAEKIAEWLSKPYLRLVYDPSDPQWEKEPAKGGATDSPEPQTGAGADVPSSDATSTEAAGPDQERTEPAPDEALRKERLKRRSCVLRRLHGDEILGVWWPALQNVYVNPERFADQPGKMSAWIVVEGWKDAWKRYWGSQGENPKDPLHRLLEECPVMNLKELDKKRKREDWEKEFDDQLKALKAAKGFPFDLPEHEKPPQGDGDKGGKGGGSDEETETEADE